MLELERVSKRFYSPREVIALDEADLRVDEGEVVLVSGASGAGKTTLLKLLYGAERAESGAVRVFGRDLRRLRRSSIALLRRRVGVVPQEIALIDDRSALDNVAVTLEVRGERRRVVRERSLAALEMVGLAGAARVPACKLSTGQRRRVTLARALVGEPAVLIADEPTGDLDSGGVDELCALLEEIRGRKGACVITTNDSLAIEIGALCGWRHLELFGGLLRESDRAAAAAPMEPGDFDVPELQPPRPDDVSNVVAFPATGS